jgi:hypothetical protein
MKTRLVIGLDDFTKPKLHNMLALIDGENGHPHRGYDEN